MFQEKLLTEVLKTHYLFLIRVNIKFGVSEMKICMDCSEIYGMAVREIYVGDERRVIGQQYQKCRCMKEKDRKEGIVDNLWPGYDFNTVVELCWCCGKRFINSGSRFSFFFCRECLDRVKKHNENPENFMIPPGRHTYLNVIMLISPFTEKEVEEFKKRVDSFFRRMDILRAWRGFSMFGNYCEVGFSFISDICLRDYEKLPRETGYDCINGKFERMVEYVYENYMKD